MVYISPDGKVHETQPWGFRRIADIFWGMIGFVCAFFTTLIRPGIDNGSATSGGGSGSGNDPSGRGPRRRIGGITTIQDCNIPGGG